MTFNSKRHMLDLFTLGFGFLSVCGNTSAADFPSFESFLNELRKQPPAEVKYFIGGSGVSPYTVFANNDSIASLLKNSYTSKDIDALAKATNTTRRINVTKRPWGTFIQAAAFASEDMGQATNYDAIWVRDSVWGYLALRSDANSEATAREVLLTLLDYMATPPQRARMAAAIKNPAILDAADGQMRAVHIRFNSQSQSFDDVQENGQPQPWTHKQNDALGLLLDAVLKAVDENFIQLDDLLKNNRLEVIVSLFAYLDAIKYYDMEDSGAWEEAARLNTSSVALVTSSFENLEKILQKSGSPFAKAFNEQAEKLGLSAIPHQEYLADIIEKGYSRIRKQLALGGESPDYPADDPHYRESDAALLNLVYPATLGRLDINDKRMVMAQVAPLAGSHGIRRYFNDNYQSANFWFHDIKTDTDEKSIEERKRSYISGSEAQWFFDSWYAKAWLMLYKESGEEADLVQGVKFANRAFGQITGQRNGKSMLGADGKPALEPALTESYNFIVSEGEMLPAPSPINPLNWAKASLTLMLEEFRQITGNGQ